MFVHCITKTYAMSDRRRFLHKCTLAILASTMPGLPAVRAFTEGTNNSATRKTILFQGDSITDAGRDRGHYYPNDGWGMGGGYVRMVASTLLGAHPKAGYRIYNRGISGNKVFQLADRWEDDCLQLRPDVLSILIGVNDFWHTLDFNYPGTAKTYENDFRDLLKRTLDELPDLQLIIAEPFAVAGGSAINEKWEAFRPYQEAARRIATDFKAAFIPLQRIFDEALHHAPASYWAPDGVHPSMAGDYLMAQAWLTVLP